MSPIWHLMFWVALPLSMWIALYEYGQIRRGR